LLPDIPCSCLSREIVSWFSKVLPYWIWWLWCDTRFYRLRA
jgi:hypothetical protein